eukprot:g9040.t1
MCSAAKQAAEDKNKEDPCPICLSTLPDTGRAVIGCGHVFCFTCIHVWVKTKPECPSCRAVFTKIIKTLTPADIAKENARVELSKRKNKEGLDKKQITKKNTFISRHNHSSNGNNSNNSNHRIKKKNARRVKTLAEGVMIKTVRIRDNTTKKKKTRPIPEYMMNYLRRQEEEEQTMLQSAQSRATALAAAAQRTAEKHVEAARALRERAKRSVQKAAMRVAREAEEKERRAMEAEDEVWRARKKADEEARRIKEAEVEARLAMKAVEAVDRAEEVPGANNPDTLEAVPSARAHSPGFGTDDEDELHDAGHACQLSRAAEYGGHQQRKRLRQPEAQESSESDDEEHPYSLWGAEAVRSARQRSWKRQQQPRLQLVQAH